MKRLIVVIVCFFMTSAALSHEAFAARADNGIEYSIITTPTGKEEVHITGPRDAHGIVNIPAKVEGLSVTEIRERALSYPLDDYILEYSEDWDVNGYPVEITAVTLPNGLKRIGAYAFSGQGFTQVTIPSSVQQIDENAFKTRKRLNVTLPKALTIQGEFVTFTGSEKLNKYLKPTISGVPIVTKEQGKLSGSLYYVVFTRNGKKEVRITDYKIVKGQKTITVPAKIAGYPVTEIGPYTFSDKSLLDNTNTIKTDLKAIKLPNSIRVIGDYAFAHFSSTFTTTMITLPTSLVEVGAYAFYNNRGVSKSLTLPKKLKTIGDYAFAGNLIQQVTIPSNVTSIGQYAFTNNEIKNVTLQTKFTTLSEGVFENNKITSFNIPTSLKHIGRRAFAKNQIVKVTLPDNIVKVGIGAFENNQIKSLKLSNKMTVIASETFKNNKLKSVTLPNRITQIGSYAFAQNQLRMITLPINLKSINEGTFQSNTLKTVTIPKSVKKIRVGAFAHNMLTEVNFSEGLETIEQEAFRSNLLTTVQLPQSLQNLEGGELIGWGVFEQNRISHITIPPKVTKLNYGTIFSPYLTYITTTAPETTIINMARFEQVFYTDENHLNRLEIGEKFGAMTIYIGLKN